MKAVNIEWDFDDVDTSIEAVQDEIEELPAEVDIPFWAVEGCEDKYDRLQAIEEYLSNEFFYCTKSFGVEG